MAHFDIAARTWSNQNSSGQYRVGKESFQATRQIIMVMYLNVLKLKSASHCVFIQNHLKKGTR